MDWRLKAAIQKALGVIPGGARIHCLLQRRVGGLADFGTECDSKVEDWWLMMVHLRAARAALAGATLLEIGTGWYPTFPLCLYLAGAGSVITVDLNRHLNKALTLQLADRLSRHLERIAEASEIGEVEIAARHLALVGALRRGASLEDATSGVVQYRAPADASQTDLADGTVDIVFSNSVLEHVPPVVIEACFVEAMRILRPEGLVFHSVNCGDHYAYVDRSIHQLNYLRYSDAQWKKWNNAFLYQNRLRAVDLTRMAEDAGFQIEIDTARAKPERLAQLASMKIHPEFARYAPEHLAVTSIDFVGRKPTFRTMANLAGRERDRRA